MIYKPVARSTYVKEGSIEPEIQIYRKIFSWNSRESSGDSVDKFFSLKREILLIYLLPRLNNNSLKSNILKFFFSKLISNRFKVKIQLPLQKVVTYKLDSAHPKSL